jgi:hypothetical protein
MLEFTGAINKKEKAWLIHFFKKELRNPYSVATMIQLLYNNHVHFTTVGADKNVCTLEWVNWLNQLALSRTDVVYIEGSIHSNHHSSGVLLNSMNNAPLFVKDTYVRISFGGNREKYMHVLVAPPNIANQEMANQYFYYNTAFLSGECHMPPMIVPPTFGAL